MAGRRVIPPNAVCRVAAQSKNTRANRVLVSVHEHDPPGAVETIPFTHLKKDFTASDPQDPCAHGSIHAVAAHAGVGLAVGQRGARAVAGALEKFPGVHVRAERGHPVGHQQRHVRPVRVAVTHVAQTPTGQMFSARTKGIVGIIQHQDVVVVVGVQAPGDEQLVLVVDADDAHGFLLGSRKGR